MGCCRHCNVPCRHSSTSLAGDSGSVQLASSAGDVGLLVAGWTEPSGNCDRCAPTRARRCHSAYLAGDGWSKVGN